MFDSQRSDLDKNTLEPGTRKKETKGRRCSDRNMGGTGKAEGERSKRRRKEEERGREKNEERRGRGGGEGRGGNLGRTCIEKE